MSRDLSLLEEEFRKIVEEKLLPHCKEQGFILIPFFTLRDPWTQARLWRQSRPFTQIRRMVEILRERRKVPWLADLLLEVGPQTGRWATNALPGASWHQWGEAMDCFVEESGRAIWNSNHPGYRTYARQAVLLGFEAGHFWDQRDSAHVQKRKDKVTLIYSWEEIEEEMRRKFGESEKEYKSKEVTDG